MEETSEERLKAGKVSWSFVASMAALLCSCAALVVSFRSPPLPTWEIPPLTKLRNAHSVGRDVAQWVGGTVPEGKGTALVTESVDEVIAHALQNDSDLIRASKGCDLSAGTWVEDLSHPLYDKQRCPFMDTVNLCHINGRPDLDYLKLSWQPRDCQMPRFNAMDFLSRMRNQRILFVGDSLGRNQFTSMLCMLAQVPKEPALVQNINGVAINKASERNQFLFLDFNVTVEYCRSNFLVEHNDVEVLVDEIESKWTQAMKGAAVVVVNTGHWWSKQKTTKKGISFKHTSSGKKHTKRQKGLAEALTTVRNYIQKTDMGLTRIFFRSISPRHRRNPGVPDLGVCKGIQHPSSEADLVKGAFGRAPDVSAQSAIFEGTTVEFLEISHLTALRPDSHISVYSSNNSLGLPAHEDCSHWCLPGIPDTWNEILYAKLLYGDRGLWAIDAPNVSQRPSSVSLSS